MGHPNIVIASGSAQEKNMLLYVSHIVKFFGILHRKIYFAR